MGCERELFPYTDLSFLFPLLTEAFSINANMPIEIPISEWETVRK